uniref:Chromosome 9 open reading frame 85 n=1 Tax=Buteo japonicus TaxID=224669 RepID=A0A8C0B271_9AVES
MLSKQVYTHKSSKYSVYTYFNFYLFIQKINAKLHDGVCQHCKGILEWRVKFSKYKLLSKPKKCVKCLQKTVKDPYHIICRPCAGKLEVCAKCGKEEEIVIPIDKGQDRTDSVTTKNVQESSGLENELDFDTNVNSIDSGEDSDGLEERFKSMNFERTEI